MRLDARTLLPFAVVAALLTSCKDKGEKATREGAPPPIVSAKASTSGSAVATSACEPSAIGLADAKLAAILPDSIAGFCVLKADAPQSWGEGTAQPIEDVANAIDGAAEAYVHDYFAKRFDRVKYISGSGAPGSKADVGVQISVYEKPENAYGHLTYKLVADADPDPDAMKKASRRPLQPIKAGGVAALGRASAYLWKGVYLVELTYDADESKTMDQATTEADAILPQFAKAIGDALPGTTDLPPDVRALPSEAEGRVPLGIEYVPAKFVWPEGKSNSLKLAIAGGYAFAYVKEGTKRSRVLSFVRDDVDVARDVIDELRKLPGATFMKEKDFGDDAVYFPFDVSGGGAGAEGKGEGVAVRKGMLVLAMIDEEHALGDSASKGSGYPRTSKDEKVAKLKALLAARAGGIPVSGAGSADASAPSAAPSSSASAPPKPASTK